MGGYRHTCLFITTHHNIFSTQGSFSSCTEIIASATRSAALPSFLNANSSINLILSSFLEDGLCKISSSAKKSSFLLPTTQVAPIERASFIYPVSNNLNTDRRFLSTFASGSKRRLITGVPQSVESMVSVEATLMHTAACFRELNRFDKWYVEVSQLSRRRGSCRSVRPRENRLSFSNRAN